jgi:hypothetical protein
MLLKVQTCLAQACVAPSGTNATNLSGPCHTGLAPPQEFAGIHRAGHSVGPRHQQLGGDLARCSDLLGAVIVGELQFRSDWLWGGSSISWPQARTV